MIAERKARRGAKLRLDYIGFALLVIGMGALQIVLDKGQEDDWFGSSFIIHLSIVAALGLIVFVLWELRRADSIVDLRLLADRNFAIGNLLMFMLGFALLATTTLLPLFVQTELGYTATDAGLVMSPGGFTVMLMMPVVGMLVAKVDARLLLAVGFAGTALALYSMTRFYGAVDYATIAWARVYQSSALALLFIPINTTALAGMPAGEEQQRLGDHQHDEKYRRQLWHLGGDDADRASRTISPECAGCACNAAQHPPTRRPSARFSRPISAIPPAPSTRCGRPRLRSTPRCSSRRHCCRSTTVSGRWR